MTNNSTNINKTKKSPLILAKLTEHKEKKKTKLKLCT